MKLLLWASVATSLLLATSLETRRFSNISAISPDNFQDHLSADLHFLMDTITASYTQSCLRVIMLPAETNATLINSSSTYSYHQFNPYNSIIMSAKNIRDSKEAIQYMSKYAEKMTRTACVAYLLSGPPDARLLPVLTDPTSSKRLTRYFLVHTQNSTEAEQFLLDQRLGKEENVAALVQEESQNKSYWCVLIRQLLHPSGSPQVLTVNRWSRDTGLTSTKNIFPQQMANFYGTKLKGCILEYRPFIIYQKTEGSLVVRPKPCIDVLLLNVIAEKMNFTYELTMPPDGFWSGRKDDGSFRGIVGEVQSGRANFSLLLSRTLDRTEAIDFTRLYFKDPLTFMTAKSLPGSPWRKIVTPFRTDVWLCVLVSVGGGSLLYHVIYHAQATLTSSRLLSSHAFMQVLASFLSQSLHNYLSLQAGKVFLGFWFLYAFLVTSYYKTSLTSTLAVPFAPPTINSLQQLYRSDYQYGMKKLTSQHQYFISSEIQLYQDLLQRMFFDHDAGNMQRTDQGNYAFISFKGFLTFNMVLHNSNPNRKNDLRIATEEFYPGGFAWGVPKGASYRRGFDEVMLRCGEAGLINKWFTDLTAHYARELKKEELTKATEETLQQEKERTKDTRQLAFTLSHLQGPFYMMLLGYSAGFLILMLEILTNLVHK